MTAKLPTGICEARDQGTWLQLHKVGALKLSVLLLASLVLVRTAWISDDAAITLRSVLNFLHGFGPTFNVDERVQAFTHPLWFLLVSGTSWLVGNVFVATLALSMVLSLQALWLLMTRVARTVWTGTLLATALLFSKAFVDFSSSGLENPLSNCLLMIGIVCATRVVELGEARHLGACVLTFSLLYLCRPDLMLLGAPVVVLAILRARLPARRTVTLLLLCSLPVVAWTAFSCFYYGSPFPNTAYAKLGTGIPLLERIPHGLAYLLDSLRRDPITLLVRSARILTHPTFEN